MVNSYYPFSYRQKSRRIRLCSLRCRSCRGTFPSLRRPYDLVLVRPRRIALQDGLMARRSDLIVSYIIDRGHAAG